MYHPRRKRTSMQAAIRELAQEAKTGLPAYSDNTPLAPRLMDILRPV
jgi:hypothetical protein